MANTVKRAILIWLSILVFNNPITLLSGFGMALVSVGVLLYNQAIQYAERVSASAATVAGDSSDSSNGEEQKNNNGRV